MIVKLYCYCIGNEVIHGPMALPDKNSPLSNCEFLHNLTDEELKIYGWYPWITPKVPEYNYHKFRLFTNRFCNGTYASEEFYTVPLTTEEYMHFYNERLYTSRPENRGKFRV